MCRKLLLVFFIFLVIYNSHGQVDQSKISAVYAGGTTYYGRDYSIEEMSNSGFNTIIVWTIHISATGGLNFNGEFELVRNGEYVGDQYYPHFREDLKKLKGPTSSVDRIEFGLSAWQSSTYDNIKDLYESEGVDPGSALYENFKALIEAIPEIDAFNNDDEGTYDVESSVAFHTMLYDLGVKTAGVPYTRASSYWKPFTDQMNAANPGSVDLMYLQVYAGGAGNDPCSESWQDLGVPIIPGLWGEGSSQGNKNAAEIEADMTAWNQECGINGGFLWLYSDFDQSSLVNQYANAINVSFDIVPQIPSQITDRFPTNEEIEISVDEDLFWKLGGFDVTSTIYFGESADLTEANILGSTQETVFDPGTLENNKTYYWKVVQSNGGGDTESEVWSFTTEVTTPMPAKVSDPFPVETGNNADTDLTLEWAEAENAFEYEVYFGETESLSLVTTTRELQISRSDLDPNKRYYWRVDAKNSAGTTSGDLWSFDTRGINLAEDAEVTPSSEQADASYHAENLVDGVYQHFAEEGEWRSRDETNPLVEFSWDNQQSLGLVVLYGNVDTTLNVLSGTLSFSDDSSISVGELPKDGGPVEMIFDQKDVTWVKFQIDQSEGEDVGLAEMEVHEYSNSEAEPGQAYMYEPVDGLIELTDRVTLRWLRGPYAISHDVYFSEDETIDENDFVLNKTGEFHVVSDLTEGTYYWRIDEVNHNGTTEGQVFSFSIGEEVEEPMLSVNESNPFIVYPNPASSEIVFKLDEPIQFGFQLHIYDVSGKLVNTLDASSTEMVANQITYYPGATLESGIYHLILETGNKTYKNKLIIEH